MRAAGFALLAPSAAKADAISLAAAVCGASEARADWAGMLAGGAVLVTLCSYILYTVWDAYLLIETPALLREAIRVEVVVAYGLVSPWYAGIVLSGYSLACIGTGIHFAISWLVCLATSHPATLGFAVLGTGMEMLLD